MCWSARLRHPFEPSFSMFKRRVADSEESGSTTDEATDEETEYDREFINDRSSSEEPMLSFDKQLAELIRKKECLKRRLKSVTARIAILRKAVKKK